MFLGLRSWRSAALRRGQGQGHRLHDCRRSEEAEQGQEEGEEARVSQVAVAQGQDEGAESGGEVRFARRDVLFFSFSLLSVYVHLQFLPMREVKC